MNGWTGGRVDGWTAKRRRRPLAPRVWRLTSRLFRVHLSTRPPVHLVLAAILLTRTAAGQAPNLTWRTLTTRHFRINFNPPLEPLARRLAADAERAYDQLSHEMHPPRGMIDVVLSDDVDFSNGSATSFPSNRIVVYANPPATESALRYTNDWTQMVITHELTHIFQLDRVRGIWALSQHVFGRSPPTFPNLYAPSWILEGLAVYEESHLAGAGRVEGSEHRMIARSSTVDAAFPRIGAWSLGQPRYPFGEAAYAYGSLFMDYLAKTRGDTTIRKFVEAQSGYLIPYLLNPPARSGFGISFTKAWSEFRDSIARTIREPGARPLQAWRQLTRDGPYAFSPRWLGDSTILYSGGPGRQTFGAYRVDLSGKEHRIGRRNGISPNLGLANGDLLFSQIEFVNPYQERSDLYVQRGGSQHRITYGKRLTTPDVRADGAIVASQITAGATHLVRLSPDGKTITPLTTGSFDEWWTEPRWSHSGDRIVASRWMRGNVSQIVVLDTLGRILHLVSSGGSIERSPSWLPGDAGVMYNSDRDGATQIYVERFADTHTFAGASTRRLSDVVTGVFDPVPSITGTHLAAIDFRINGYHLGVGTYDANSGTPVPDYRDTLPHAGVAPLITNDTTRVGPYHAWYSFYPRYWLPVINPGIDGGYRIGVLTTGDDVIGRHSMQAQVAFPTNNTGIVGEVSYQYAGLGLPILSVDAFQDWQSLGGVFAPTPGRPIIGEVFRRVREADFLATYLRQHVRSALSISGGFGVESRSHTTTAPVSIAQLDTAGELGSPSFPTLTAALGYANYQRPPFSISPEDGFQFNATVRDRLRSGPAGQGGASLSTVGILSLYKSLDLPGFAHHVIALRGAVGWADVNANGYYVVGGVSGGTFQIVPGYTVGEGRSTFPVRGFPSGTLFGTRAFAGTAEYRAPLRMIGDAVGILPFFFDRTSLTLFSDVGSAWCPNVAPGREVCNTFNPLLTTRTDIASAGAELNVNLGVLSWDSAYRFRLGVVAPTYNRELFGQRAVQVYAVTGVYF
ncbi:MAG TPA: hypothetical protein VGQ44_07520 [Gemmatimonadaceae bacterium]|nr:hypothetical protein [Gemmatimonadaceae bacterium]